MQNRAGPWPAITGPNMRRIAGSSRWRFITGSGNLQVMIVFNWDRALPDMKLWMMAGWL